MHKSKTLVARIGRWLWYWTPPIVLMAFIFYLSNQPSLPQAPGPWLDAVIKKLSHVLVFTALFLLLYRAWRAYIPVSVRLPVALLTTAAYALSDELHQSLVPGRHANWYDVLIDLLVPVLLTVLLQTGLRRRFFSS